MNDPENQDYFKVKVQGKAKVQDKIKFIDPLGYRA